jgi:hypothetical protein
MHLMDSGASSESYDQAMMADPYGGSASQVFGLSSYTLAIPALS